MAAITCGIPRMIATERAAVTPATYLRRRLVAATLLVGVVLAVLVLSARLVVGLLGGGPLTASEPSLPLQLTPVGHAVHVVQPGDTLWSIARSAQPAGDVRPLVDSLAEQRQGRPLQLGERIAVP